MLLSNESEIVNWDYFYVYVLTLLYITYLNLLQYVEFSIYYARACP